MLQQLPETGAARERRWGWIVPSVAVHVAIITAVALAQADVVEVPAPGVTVDTIVFPMPDPPDRRGGGTGSGNGDVRTPQPPTIPHPDFDTGTIPETQTPTIWPSSGDSVGVDGLLANGPPATVASAPGGAFGEATVDESVRVRVESMPRYPPALRAIGIEGVVEMEFVVDTTGRADVATARVITSPDERFTAAVRSALRDTRFVPGRYHGRAVRTLVRRAFRFELGDGR